VNILHEAGRQMAVEAKTKAANVLLAPTLNVIRSPLGAFYMVDIKSNFLQLMQEDGITKHILKIQSFLESLRLQLSMV
jgi:hypothetical protein